MGIDISYEAGNWTTDYDGEYQPKGSTGLVLKLLADAANALNRSHPRYVFSKCWPLSLVANTTQVPLLSFKFDPSNAQHSNHAWMDVDIVGVIPVSNANNPAVNATARPISGVPVLYFPHNTPVTPGNNGSCNFSGCSAAYDKMYIKGTMGAFEFLVTSNNNARIAAISYAVIPEHISEGEITVYPDDYKAGNPIQKQSIGKIANAIHRLRCTKLGTAFSWAATGVRATPTPPGNQTGMAINSDSYVNVLDQTVTDYTTNSPGSFCNVEYAGVGSTTQEAGKKVKVRCMVFANCNANSYVKFIGPNSFTNNWTEVKIVADTGLAWHDNADHYIFLDSTILSNSGTDFNKIDVHAKTAANGDALYIYGLYGQIEYYNNH